MIGLHDNFAVALEDEEVDDICILCISERSLSIVIISWDCISWRTFPDSLI